MTALTPRISRSNMSAVSTTTDHSVRVHAYMLHGALTLSRLAYMLHEGSRVCITAECQDKSFVVKGSLTSIISLLDIASFHLSLEKEQLSKEKPRKAKDKIILQDKQKVIILKQSLKSALETLTSLTLFWMASVDENNPRLPITSTFLVFNALGDCYMRDSGKTIPEFFEPLIKKVARCGARLHSLSFRSTIATTQSAAQAALASSSSQSDSRCRRIYNGACSVLTTCVNKVREGFNCRRNPANVRSSGL